MESPSAKSNERGGSERRIGKPQPPTFIPAKYLPNLLRYKYSGSDMSIASRYVMQPYWNFVVSLVPMTVAPNMITFTGFLIGMSSSVLILYYYFFANAVYPPWLWFYTAFSLFAYQTLDAIDGKQARRTGTGSPLGELFDHGCDAVLTPFVQMNAAVAIGMPPWMLFVYMWESSFGLFTAIFEQFCTGVFDLGYLSGPTEGILLTCGVFCVTGIMSNEFWSTSLVGPYDYVLPAGLTTLVSKDPVTVHIESIRSCVFIFFQVVWFITVAGNLGHTLTRPPVHSSRAVPYLKAIPTFAVAVMNVAVTVFFRETHRAFPFVFELSFGILMSFTVTRMTIARLCSMPFQPFNLLYMMNFMVSGVALALRVINPTLAASAEISQCLGWSMVALTVFGFFQYGVMIISVFRQVANFLSIKVLSISPKE